MCVAADVGNAVTGGSTSSASDTKAKADAAKDAAAAIAAANQAAHDKIVGSAVAQDQAGGLRATVLTGVNGDEGYGNNVQPSASLAPKKKTKLGEPPTPLSGY